MQNNDSTLRAVVKSIDIATLTRASVFDLPSNQKLSETILKTDLNHTERKLVNEWCVVVWQEIDQLQWYLCFMCGELQNDKYS